MLVSSIHGKHNLVIMHFSGRITSKDLKKNFDDFTSRDDFRFNMNSLILIEQATPVFKASELIAHSEYINSRREIRGNDYKIAVVSQDIQWQRFLKLFKVSSKQKPFDFNYFDSIESATQWLFKKSISDPVIYKDILIYTKNNTQPGSQAQKHS